ncbi:hypothetical protein [Paludisphaera mucosa]|uniref:Tat pathway signal sequence domain protein n=1 Tax=Paludisphaera mucosa TaxID=3030827 RepID=A0ABT6FH69_9BACT|nr:hypothetical protein [Paludisphaera mucosa]MDG3006887.1 hypothetical protein [Paludisphaera mucosa]
MRVRFWKVSALAAGFVTASVFVPTLFGQEAKAAPGPKKPTVEAPRAKVKSRSIELKVAISDLGAKGCELEIKPANASCVFKPQVLRVEPGGTVDASLKDVEIRGADRNCALALTIREEGQPAKTVYRGYRVAADPRPGSTEKFVCYMSSPSKVAAIAASGAPPARR